MFPIRLIVSHETGLKPLPLPRSVDAFELQVAARLCGSPQESGGVVPVHVHHALEY